MPHIQILVNNQSVDVPVDLDLSFKFENSLFQLDGDLSNRTQEFTLPATPKNNNIFKMTYRYNSSSSVSSAQRKMDACIIIGYVPLYGYIYVTKHSKRNGYDCCFVEKKQAIFQELLGYDKLADFYVTDKYITIPNSSDANVFTNGNDFLSYYSYRNTLNHPTGGNPNLFIPCINIKDLILDICRNYNISVDMDNLRDDLYIKMGDSHKLADGNIISNVFFTYTNFNHYASLRLFYYYGNPSIYSGDGSECLIAGMYRIQAYMVVPTGTVEDGATYVNGTVSIYRNKKLKYYVYSPYFSGSTDTSFYFVEVLNDGTTKETAITLDPNGYTDLWVKLEVGDEIINTAYLWKRLGGYYFKTLPARAIYYPDGVVGGDGLESGMNWYLMANLPDVSFYELLLTYGFLNGYYFPIFRDETTIEFFSLFDKTKRIVIQDIDMLYDADMDVVYEIESSAQKNYFAFEEPTDQEYPGSNIKVGKSKFVIYNNNENLEKESDIFEIPFANIATDVDKSNNYDFSVGYCIDADAEEMDGSPDLIYKYKGNGNNMIGMYFYNDKHENTIISFNFPLNYTKSDFEKIYSNSICLTIGVRMLFDKFNQIKDDSVVYYNGSYFAVVSGDWSNNIATLELALIE